MVIFHGYVSHNQMVWDIFMAFMDILVHGSWMFRVGVIPSWPGVKPYPP